MKVGISLPHTGAGASPALVRQVATVADEVGFDSLWGVDHVLLPWHTESRYTLKREPTEIGDGALSRRLSPNYELMTTLAWVAGFTERISLGTTVAVLTIRNAVLNARQVSTLDVYSGGRVLYGVGVGWLREEAEAMGMPWTERGQRAEEHIRLLRTLWAAEGEVVDFEGPYHRLPPVDPEPRPARRIPILVGGHSEVALDRAARLGDGWIASRMSLERFRAARADLAAACERHGRDVGELEVVVNATVLSDAAGLAAPDLVERLAAYRDAGATHVQLPTPDGPPERIDQELRRAAVEVLPELR